MIPMFLQDSQFTTTLLGETVTLSILNFRFVIIWIINSLVMLFIKTDLDRNKIQAPWVLALTIFNAMAGIVISGLLLHVSNLEHKPNEHR
jgi:hypothetical protein